MSPDPNFNFEPHQLSPDSGGHGGSYPELDPAERQHVFERFEQNRQFFNGHLGLRIIDARRGYAKLAVDNVPHLCQPAMVMHGGASFGMADTAVAFALGSIYGFSAILLTIEMKINYLEPIPLGPVTAEAYVLRASRRSAYAEVDVWASGKLAARATTTYMIRFPKKTE